MKLERSLTPYTKINSKWVKDLNVRPDTIKLLEENLGRILYDLNHSKILFDPPPTEMEIKTKINKWDLVKLKSFCKAKETINKMERQSMEWETIVANHISEKRLISKFYPSIKGTPTTQQQTKNKTKQKTNYTNNMIKKIGVGTEYTFLQRRHADVQQAHEKHH